MVSRQEFTVADQRFGDITVILNLIQIKSITGKLARSVNRQAWSVGQNTFKQSDTTATRELSPREQYRNYSASAKMLVPLES